MKLLNLIFLIFILSGCQTTVQEYNSPKSFANSENSVEVWMNDDGLNNAIFLTINGVKAWQRKALQGGAMSVTLPEGSNSLDIRMVYTEFMEFPEEKEINIQAEFSSKYKYVFVSKYNKESKTFTYRFEKVNKDAKCKYGPTNFKRIITGQLICSYNGKEYKFT